jgi:tryptophan-rich sensory protein
MQPNVYACVATPVLSALVMNAIIAIRGWGRSATQKCALLPPGFVIGAVWTVIFGFLGYTWYLVWNDALAHLSIVVLIMFCLIYPVVTRIADSDRFDHILNLTSMVLAFVTMLTAQRVEPRTVYTLAAIAVWSTYVNYATILCVDE